MSVPDFFSQVEDAVIALVKEHIENKSIYFKKPEKQVVKSNFTVLSEGFDYFFFTLPGSFPTTTGGVGVINVKWNINIEIFVRFSQPQSTWANFKAFRSDIFNLFNVRMIGRTLNRTPGVLEVLLSSDSEPIAYGEEDSRDDPVFYSQAMQLSVDFKVNKV